MAVSRREFLRSATQAAGVLLLGCGDEAGPRIAGEGDMPLPAPDGCDDVFAGGELLGEAPFVGEDIPALDTPLGVGWDGRLYFDHSGLTADTLVVPNDRFYIRTRYPDLLVPPDPWVIHIRGQVDREEDLALVDLEQLERGMGVHLLECSGNRGSGFGLISAAEWSGIPMADVLARIGELPPGARVLVSGFDEHSTPSEGGHSTPGASWIFAPDELVDREAFLATKMNGQPLPPDHGEPVRLFIPGWYGCCAIKWVDLIRIVDENEPPTAQMLEFAERTHQPSPPPALARDFLPATLDQAAMAVRVERWRLAGGELASRVVGVTWGGYQVTDALEIRFGDGGWEPVHVCPPQMTNRTWTLWTHAWRPAEPGVFAVRLRVADPSIPQKRLDSGWYTRQVEIDAV